MFLKFPTGYGNMIGKIVRLNKGLRIKGSFEKVCIYCISEKLVETAFAQFMPDPCIF